MFLRAMYSRRDRRGVHNSAEGALASPVLSLGKVSLSAGLASSSVLALEVVEVVVDEFEEPV